MYVYSKRKHTEPPPPLPGANKTKDADAYGKKEGCQNSPESQKHTHSIHCTENLKNIFPEMKLHTLVLNFYIHGRDLYFPMIGRIWSLYFPVLRESTLGSTTGAEKKAGNFHQAVVGGSSLPSPWLLWLSQEFT
jgi:hypothetical protein